MDGKLVKAIIAGRYEVSLYEMDDGTFSVQYSTDDIGTVNTHNISDLRMALFMFDTKVDELEGQ